jgi:hypothetical protein
MMGKMLAAIADCHICADGRRSTVRVTGTRVDSRFAGTRKVQIPMQFDRENSANVCKSSIIIYGQVTPIIVILQICDICQSNLMWSLHRFDIYLYIVK